MTKTTNYTKASLFFAIAATVWLPVSLLVNPGWGSLVLFSPIILVSLAPIVIYKINKSQVGGALPRRIFWAQLAFYILWMSLGFFFVNGGDVDEGVGSIFTHILSGFFDRHLLVRISEQLLELAFCLTLASAIYCMYLAAQSQDSTFNYARSLIVGSVLVAIAIMTPITIEEFTSRIKFNHYYSDMEQVRHEVMDKVGAVEQVKEAVTIGDGFIDSLGCYPRSECPVMQRTWLIALEPGKEEATLTSALLDAGFNVDSYRLTALSVPPCQLGNTIECSLWGSKKNGEREALQVTLRQVSSVDAPKQSIAPRIWVAVEVRLR